MKCASLARLIGTVSLALPVVVAADPGEASACGSAVYLARARRPDPPAPKPVEVKPIEFPAPVEVLPPSPVQIIPPFPAPKHIEIIPPFPAPRPRPPVQPKIDKPQLVADAEQDLSEGKHARAALMVAAAFPALHKVAPGTSTMADRALRVLALASVRRDGRLDVGGMKGKTAGDRAANLAWSVAVLDSLTAARANNPLYQTDLGEALARVPERRADAAKLLGDLADRDLVTSAEGYAALARLRAEQGDEGTRAALLERCARMTQTPAICAAPGKAGRS